MKQFAGVMMALAVAGMPTNALASGQLWRGPCKFSHEILAQDEFDINNLIQDKLFVGTHTATLVPDDLSAATSNNLISACHAIWKLNLEKEVSMVEFLKEIEGKTTDTKFYSVTTDGNFSIGVATLKYKGRLINENEVFPKCKNSIEKLSSYKNGDLTGYINIGFRKHDFKDETCGIFLLFKNYRYDSISQKYFHSAGFAVPLGREGENRYGIDESFSIAFSDKLMISYEYWADGS